MTNRMKNNNSICCYNFLFYLLQNKKDDLSTNDSHLAGHRSSRHRRKHLSSRSRCMSKTKIISPNIKEVDNDYRISSLEIKHKRKDKHKNKLVNNNNDNDDDGDEKLDSNMVSTPESGNVYFSFIIIFI